MPVSVLCGKTREKVEEQAKISENTKTTITTTKNNQNPFRFSSKIYTKYIPDSMSNPVCFFSDDHSSFTGVLYN